MRVIAGNQRGRALAGPDNDGATRPITDRVKENLFNRLQSLGMLAPDEPEQTWRALDIFSGSGSLGIECLSRGADRCVFVESDRGALTALESNLTGLGLRDRAEVLATAASPPAWARGLTPGSVRLAFVDPPYAMSADPAGARALAGVLAALLPAFEPGGVCVWRTERGVCPAQQPGYDGPESVSYGGMELHFFQAPLALETDPETGPQDP
ncbi:MAG: RsmD family RNA methyltransferase [Planctomycetota bacterium]